MKKRAFCILLATVMVFSLLPLTVLADSYPSFILGEEILVELDVDESVWYRFTPEETWRYYIESYNASEVDPLCIVYDSEMTPIMSDDDSAGNHNFKVNVELNAGETYYFEFQEYGNVNAGTYNVKASIVVPDSISLSENEYTSYIGGKLKLEVTFDPYYLSVPLVWSSSDDSVATVDENGNVQFVGEGVATITATAKGGAEDSCVVTVKYSEPISLGEVKTVTMDGTLEERQVIAAYRFVPEVSGYYEVYSYDIQPSGEGSPDPRLWLYGDDMDYELDYNDDSGEENNFALQHRLEEGKTYFYLIDPYDPAAIGSFKVTIFKNAAPTSIKIDVDDLTLNQGDYFSLYSTQYPEGCAIEKVVWSSSDETVFSINSENGSGYAVGPGTATITVTNESGLSDTCIITVKPAVVLSFDTVFTVEKASDDSESKTRFKFVPEVSGVYRFESFNIVGESVDPSISLRNTHDTLRYNDNNDVDANFILDHEMIADQIYYIDIDLNTDSKGSADFKVTKLDESKFPELTPYTDIEVTNTYGGAFSYFSFTPTISGYYTFLSSLPEGSSLDPRCLLLNADWETQNGNDDSGEGSNYYFEEQLIAGETYYFKTFLYDSTDIGTHSFRVELLNGLNIEANIIEDVEFSKDETATVGAVFNIQNATEVGEPRLFLVNYGIYEHFSNLSFESEDSYTADFDFTKAEFVDGENSKTFVFGVPVDDVWYYTNEFTVTYNDDSSEYSLGDVDADGDVDQMDYLFVKRAYFDTYTLSEDQILRADVDADGDVDQMDYLYIKRAYFGTYTIG